GPGNNPLRFFAVELALHCSIPLQPESAMSRAAALPPTASIPDPPSRKEIPDYAPLMAARHEAHRAELSRIVAELPIDPGSRVLDVPCGDGFYLPYLARAVGSSGKVVGADIAPA